MITVLLQYLFKKNIFIGVIMMTFFFNCDNTCLDYFNTSYFVND